MSAISAPVPVDLEVPIRHRADAYAVPTPYLPPRPSARPKRAKARAANRVGAVLTDAVFAAVFGWAVIGASGFLGNVLLEAANRDARDSVSRATSANTAENKLRASVNYLVSDEAVQHWASFNQFVPPYSLEPPSVK